MPCNDQLWPTKSTRWAIKSVRVQAHTVCVCECECVCEWEGLCVNLCVFCCTYNIQYAYLQIFVYWAFIVIVMILQHLWHFKDGIGITSSSPLDYFLSFTLMLVSLSYGNIRVQWSLIMHSEINAILQKCLVFAVTVLHSCVPIVRCLRGKTQI